MLDEADELSAFRNEFYIADPHLIYLDGNSLGRMPLRTIQILRDAAVEQWGSGLVRSWGQGWMDAPRRVGEKIGQLIGAAPSQVVVSDSTSVNLYKLVMAALALRPGRRTILSDEYNFPSDLYVMQGCARQTGHDLRLATASDNPTETLLHSINTDTALVSLSLVSFKSGYLYDAAAITQRAHEMGALILWDLSHAAGAVPLNLDEWQVDFAVGCTYKYLNGGPGAPAYLYIHPQWQEQALSPIWGWLGDGAPFAFDLEYHPAQGAARFLAGSPPVLSLLSIEPGVDVLIRAGMERVRRKSIQQTSYLIDLFDQVLAPLGFELGSPRLAAERGGHISLRARRRLPHEPRPHRRDERYPRFPRTRLYPPGTVAPIHHLSRDI